MFHGKPLYVALAQRKQDRQAILQQHFNQLARMVGSANSIIPTGYPHVYFAHPAAHLPQGHPRHGFVYPPMAIGHEWRPNMFPSPQNPQQIQSPMVCSCLEIESLDTCYCSVSKGSCTMSIDAEFAKAFQKQQGRDGGEYGASFPWSSHHELRRTCATS
jgi:hypothetical protein